jgi:predicted nucleic acid-binding protein
VPPSAGAAGSGGAGTPHAGLAQALLDTNVVLDLFLQRDPWYTQAQPMWEARDQGRLFAYLPASVLTDIFYICRKLVGSDRAKRIVEDCLAGYVILPVDRVVLERALTLAGSDFEDNVQIACAEGAGLDLIVTRDPGDFGHAPMPAVVPPDVPARLAS